MRERERTRDEDAAEVDWLDRAVERWPHLAVAMVVGEWAMLGLAVRIWFEGR